MVAARATIEQLKAVELEDYFQDDCVAQLQARTQSIDDLPAGTAAIYPVFLGTRSVLLVSIRGELRQFVLAHGEAEIREQVRNCRLALETRNSNRYRRYARTLFDWLIRPIEPALRERGVDTLVIVPEGPLRTVPLAALYDGETDKFLIEKFAIATAPGLNLVDLRPFPRQDLRVLINGLSEARAGFSELPFVGDEVDSIRTAIGGRVLLNEAFKLDTIERELRETPYSIVHIASHGEFSSDPAETFVLTYDQKLTMNQLEAFMKFGQFRRDPFDMLTLSACQTAAGDERAALGLAGVAVKAGARSALATLWFINDQASARLVASVYDALLDPDVTKAKALQRAQIAFISDARYRHPGYWSPFLLIGNWL